MLGIRLILRFRSGLTIKNRDVLMVISLLVVAPVLHVCHNTFHFNPIVQFIFVIATMGGLLVWTYFYDVGMIHSWLDTGLDKQLSLLDSIRQGHLDDTPAGNYLESVKDVFQPEDYYDIICYVLLHVELSVASRSRVMLRESGLERELPLTNEMKEQILSQYTEYKILEKRLGNAARMTIAPIVKFDPAEYKALEDLRAECKKN
jgi:hypothetical protein